MKMSLTRRFLLIITGIIMISSFISYLIFLNVMRDRYVQNFTDEMDKAELVLSDYLENRFSLLSSGVEILQSDPRFLASIVEGDPNTTQAEIADFRSLVKADFLIINDRSGHILAQEPAITNVELNDALRHLNPQSGRLLQTYLPIGHQIHQVIAADISQGLPLGRLVAGYEIGKRVIEKVEQLTACDVTLMSHGTVADRKPGRLDFNTGVLDDLSSRSGALISGKVYIVQHDGEDFLVLLHFLHGQENTALILSRSLGTQLDLAMTRIFWLLGLSFLTTLVVSIITISLFITRNLGTAVDRLVNAAKTISRGDLSDPVIPHRNDELGVLAQRFDEMRLELIKSQEALLQSQSKHIQAERMATIGNLTSGIIHDFKSKMTVISLAMQSISTGNLDKEKQKIYASKVNNQVSDMINLTQEILEFSRGEKALTLSELDFTSYFLAQLRIHQENFSRNHITLDYSLPEPFDARLDTQKFKRVLENILNNAYEALTPGQHIQIGLSFDEEQFSIQIKDNGVGIPPEILPNLFDPFVTHGKRTGTGLGLSISQKIVEDHGGTISVESEVNKGTVFTITVPRNLALK